mgnify:CR=1 FL=1
MPRKLRIDLVNFPFLCRPMQAIIRFFLISALFIPSWEAHSQCTEWQNPTPESGYSIFSELPCTGDTLRILDFEVWQSEAYTIPNALEGATYEFNHCEGPNANSWTPDYTVIAPSGNVEAFGEGTGCSFSWTAAESGDYLVVVNEAGNCGIEGTDDNGFPAIITLENGVPCPLPPVLVEGAESFEEGVFPDCWETVDANQDGFNWFISETVGAFDGDYVVRSNSFSSIAGAINPDNYLITPPFQPEDGDSLYYVIAALDPSFPAENYSVLISTEGTSVDDFTDEVFTEVLTSASYQGRSIDLSEYADDIIYVAFRHHDVVDQSSILLDAIALPGTIIDCATVNTENRDLSESISLFPNPAHGRVTIANQAEEKIFDIDVFDVTGKRVLAFRQKFLDADTPIDLSELEAGLYLFRFESEASVGTLKLLVK